MTPDEQDRFRGCLLGLAAGDALGTTLEFQPPGSFQPITDMIGGGPFGLKPGEWTDDTSMALCLGQSLLDQGRHDPQDQMARYCQWWRSGYFSSTGECFDIGNTVRGSLKRFLRTGDPIAGPAGEYSAGNGSLMRLAPVPMFEAADIDAAAHRSGESSLTTHGATAAVDACRFYGVLIALALRGASKEEILDYRPERGEPPCPEIQEIIGGSYRRKGPPAIAGTGYVVKSLEAALWAFFHSTDFRDGALRAINLGDDADTTGAIYGQLAGAHYGRAGIPAQWLDRLTMRATIQSMADGLLVASKR